MAIPRNLSNLAQGADTSGVLGTSKGGTGSTSTTFANLATNVTGTLPVANGGTGLSSVGTNGNVLTSNGSAWVSSAPQSGAMIKLASVNWNSTYDATLSNIFSSSYQVYKIYFRAYSNQEGGFTMNPWFRFIVGSTIDNNAGYLNRYFTVAGGSTGGTQNAIIIQNYQGSTNSYRPYVFEFTLYCENFADSTSGIMVTATGGSDGQMVVSSATNYRKDQGSPITGFYYLNQNGLNTVGNMTAYAIVP